MSSRLKCMVGVLISTGLVVAIVAVLPGVAEAQTASTKDGQAAAANADANLARVVVKPGDSLWSISSERLDRNATPQRIVNGAEQIYALNRGQIGANPNLIFVGQEFVLPNILVRPATAERSTRSTTGATPASRTAEVGEAGPKGQTVKSATNKAQRKAFGSAAGKREGAAKPPAELADLRDVRAAPVPTVRPLSSNGSPPSLADSLLRRVRSAVAPAVPALKESFASTRANDGRRLLGVGFLVLTFVVAVLMARKLSTRRTTRRGDAECEGTLAGYYEHYHETPAPHRVTPSAYHPDSLKGRDITASLLRSNAEKYIRRPKTRITASLLRSNAEKYIRRPKTRKVEASANNHEAHNGDAFEASRIRKAVAAGRGRTLNAKKARAVPRNGLALGTHSPVVRYASQRARAARRARKVRPQRGVARRPRALATVDKKGGERP